MPINLDKKLSACPSSVSLSDDSLTELKQSFNKMTDVLKNIAFMQNAQTILLQEALETDILDETDELNKDTSIQMK